MHVASLPVLAATGLMAEARIAHGSGVVTLAGGGDPARLALMLQGALARGARAVISFGIAGGLAPGLRPGTTILARAVTHDGVRLQADEDWVGRLAYYLPHATVAELAGVDRVVTGPSGKRALHEATGAAAVDMESHVAARLAAQHGVPFAALRVVADPAHRTLPEAALVGMRPDGGTDTRGVLRALARRPSEMPALIRTAMDASAAFAALRSSRQRLCGTLGFDATALAGAAAAPERPGIELDVGLFGTASEAQVENV